MLAVYARLRAELFIFLLSLLPASVGSAALLRVGGGVLLSMLAALAGSALRLCVVGGGVLLSMLSASAGTARCVRAGFFFLCWPLRLLQLCVCVRVRVCVSVSPNSCVPQHPCVRHWR